MTMENFENIRHVSRLGPIEKNLPDIFVIGDPSWCVKTDVVKRFEHEKDKIIMHEVHVLFHCDKNYHDDREIRFGISNSTEKDYVVKFNSLQDGKHLGDFLCRKDKTMTIKSRGKLDKLYV